MKPLARSDSYMDKSTRVLPINTPAMPTHRRAASRYSFVDAPNITCVCQLWTGSIPAELTLDPAINVKSSAARILGIFLFAAGLLVVSLVLT
jgi:hypothetical protein